MTFDNLLGGPPPTLLPDDPAASRLTAGDDPEVVVRRHPASSTAWAALADAALRAGQDVPGYAYARVGYHRGLDALRRTGWKGHGPIPWCHEPNRGFLRCLAALAEAANRIGETDESDRCRQFLADSDPEAARELDAGD
jgi:hypothetical protein